ncbi:MAG: hypothetical protein ACPHID_03045 [Thermoplasmatota archaeon]
MTKRRFAIALATVFLLGIFAAPTTVAQLPIPQSTFVMDYSGNPQEPVEPLVTKTFKIDYTFGFTNQVQNTGGVQGAAQAQFDINCDSGVTVSGPESDIIPIPPTPSAGNFEHDGSLTYQLTVSREVKAREPLRCDITGSVITPSEQTMPAPPDVSRNFLVQAEYFSLIEAKTDLKLKQGGPQKQIPFNLEVTNFGNGQTKINFEVTEKPSGKWQGLAPDVLLLDEKGGTRESSTVAFTVVTPFKNGWNNEEGGFTVLLKPEYSFDPDQKGSEVAVTLVARVRGVYVPSLEPLVMVGAVLGTAFIARLVKEE